MPEYPIGPAYRFPTKVDAWIAILLWVGIGAGVVGGSYALIESRMWFLVPLCLLPLGIVFGLAWPTHYTVQGDTLVIRSGLIRFHVPLEKVELIQPTRNPLSSPAWSLDRLFIRYGYASIMISPVDREAFLDVIASHAPHLERRGDRLVRPVAA